MSASTRRSRLHVLARVALALAVLGAADVGIAAVPEAVARSRTSAPARAETSESKPGWRRVPEWMRRNLDPRRLGGARKDESAQAAPPARAAKPKARVAAKPARPKPAPPQAVAPVPAPAPAPIAVEPAPAPTPATRFAATRALDATLERVGAIAVLLGLLAMGWGIFRGRRAAAPLPPPTVVVPVAVLGAGEAIEPTIATARRDSTIDVAVETAIVHADVTAQAFPVDGRYEILREIGRGGMGVVYEARDKRLDRIVALKRLPETLGTDSSAIALLLREARSAARLNHRNIVTVHDVDREDGAWFLVMELLEGELLSTLLSREGRLAPRAVIWIAEQVAAGLAYAHERGIVHRDVKPSNLFVTRERIVKLMDFGVAKIVEEARRSRTLVGGTPSYMSPEQAAGDAVDGRTDLYALGATLFELLTGQVPFPKGDPAYHHQLTQPPDPRERARGIPEPLAALVLALLRKRADERPASANEVAARLREIAAATLPGAER